jgi:hypothetical protein
MPTTQTPAAPAAQPQPGYTSRSGTRAGSCSTRTTRLCASLNRKDAQEVIRRLTLHA